MSSKQEPKKTDGGNLTDDIAELMMKYKLKKIKIYNVTTTGYTTIMDLLKMKAKGLLIPTPSQYEQEYLAQKLKSEIIAPSCKQEKFKVSKLEKIPFYKGFKDVSVAQNWNELFKLFNS